MRDQPTPDGDEQPTTTRRRAVAALGALPLGGALATGAAAARESTDSDANPGSDADKTGFDVPDTCPFHDTPLEAAGDGRLRCPESESESEHPRETWAAISADMNIPIDALAARVEVTVPEDVYQVARTRAAVATDGEPTDRAIGERLMDYLDLRFTWIREETGEVIHPDD